MTKPPGPVERRDYPGRPIVGVGALIVREQQILLIRRSKPPRAGQWSLPGGAQELGESVHDALVREVREETGLDLVAAELFEIIDLIDRDDEKRVRFHYTLIDFLCRPHAGDPVAGSDAGAVGWFAADAIDGLGLWSETRRVILKALEAAGQS